MINSDTLVLAAALRPRLPISSQDLLFIWFGLGTLLGSSCYSYAGIRTRPPDLLVRADREAVPLLAQTVLHYKLKLHADINLHLLSILRHVMIRGN